MAQAETQGGTVTPPKTLVLSDFDGTISEKDVACALFDRFADPNWREVNDLFWSGKISWQEEYKRIFSTINAPRKEIEAFLDSLKLDQYFKEFLGFCQEAGYEFRIISCGLDFYISRILTANGLDGLPFSSNHWRYDGDEIVLEFISNEPADQCPRHPFICANCKQTLLSELKTPGQEIIYIGDGQSDICPAKMADIVFAKADLLEACKTEGISVIPFTTFADILEHLRHMKRAT